MYTQQEVSPPKENKHNNLNKTSHHLVFSRKWTKGVFGRGANILNTFNSRYWSLDCNNLILMDHMYYTSAIQEATTLTPNSAAQVSCKIVEKNVKVIMATPKFNSLVQDLNYLYCFPENTSKLYLKKISLYNQVRNYWQNNEKNLQSTHNWLTKSNLNTLLGSGSATKKISCFVFWLVSLTKACENKTKVKNYHP